MQQALSVHRQILKEAWNITWRFKRLWVLGAFASFWTTNTLFGKFLNPPIALSPARWHAAWWTTPAIDGSISIAAVLGLLVGMALMGAILWMTTSSRGGLIAAVNAAEQGKTTALREAWSIGTRRFWSVLCISIVGKLLWGLLFLGMFAVAAAVSSWETASQAVAYSAAFIAIAFAALSLAFIVNYSLSFAVLHRLNVWQSSIAGVRLFFKHWLLSLELAVILYGLGIVVGIVFAAFLIVLVMPLALLWAVTAALGQMAWFFAVALPVAVIVLLAAIALGAAFSTFQFAAWIVLFKRIVAGNAISKLVRLFHSSR